MKSPVTLGADPELFLRDFSGKLISAIGKFGGTKQQPKPMEKLPNFFIQEDNVAVEFNVPPTNDRRTFMNNIVKALDHIEKQAHKLKLELAIIPSGEFSVDQLQHPLAKRFGCDADFNVWTLNQNPQPKSANKNLRSAGAHVHIAYNKDFVKLGRSCDLFAGCPSIIFDSDMQRRLLYGKAGACRKKPYGLEYRVLSNFWLTKPRLTAMIFNQICQALNFVMSDKQIDEKDHETIITCINNADKNALRYLTRKYDLQY